jgi:hypothetical protein
MIRGSCLCGTVAFEIDGALTPIQLCHATRCRKASGAAYSPEILCDDETLRWLTGEEAITHYRAPLLHEPPAYHRAFCRICGSPLPAAVVGTTWMALNAGVLDDDPGTRPFRHAFVEQKACWHRIVDELPRFAARPPIPG